MSKSPAYAREVSARRQRGERIGLLVVAVHDWNSGKWFDGRPEVARVVIPEDLPLNSVRFDFAHALDVLLCGAGSAVDFNTVADALSKAEPASVWAEYSDGIWCMESSSGGWLAVDGPFPVQWLARAIKTNRLWRLLRGVGIYGRPVFFEARKAACLELFGDDAEVVMREVLGAPSGDLSGLLTTKAA